MRIIFCIAIWLMFFQTTAMGQEEKARLAQRMYSFFHCSSLALLAGNDKEANRLFALGINDGRAFLAAVEKRQITQEQMSEHVPVGITLKMKGPSADFILGRVYESIRNDTYTEVVKLDDTGFPLAPDKVILDPEFRKMKSDRNFRRANCELLK
jgi:hypothetical protein